MRAFQGVPSAGEAATLYREHLRRRLRQCEVPEHLHQGLTEYLAARRPVGDFLTAVLSNDLTGACTRADDVCAAQLHRVVGFLINYVTAEAWGSAARVSAWLADPVPPRPVFE